MKINICLVQPVGYIHSLALLELGEYLQAKFVRLGHKCDFVKNRTDDGALNVILGAHLIRDTTGLPKSTIIFNTEQFGDDNQWTKAETYRSLLDTHFVWDYSSLNAKNLSTDQYSVIELGYEEKLRRITLDTKKSIDLLFYGSVNERRKKIIDELIARGIEVQVVSNLYSTERDDYLKSCKAVLNMHYYEAQVFQTIRAFYPLTNGIPIITESFTPQDFSNKYRDFVIAPDKESFVDFAVRSLENSAQFKHRSDAAIGAFATYDGLDSIELALDKAEDTIGTSYARATEPSIVRNKMNLGSGKDYKPGYLNVDILEAKQPDIVVNLSKSLSLPSVIKGQQDRNYSIDRNQFDEIVANDVLEHVPDLITLMTNCLNLIKIGGVMKISVPYELSLGAWQDPTHVRAFNENSWKYYTDWFWYLEWFEYRFALVDMSFQLSPGGTEMHKTGKPIKEILVSPRATESMSVVLKKVLTTSEERTIARSYRGSLVQEVWRSPLIS